MVDWLGISGATGLLDFQRGHVPNGQACECPALCTTDGSGAENEGAMRMLR